jgi:hypothetical protein
VQWLRGLERARGVATAGTNGAPHAMSADEHNAAGR